MTIELVKKVQRNIFKRKSKDENFYSPLIFDAILLVNKDDRHQNISFIPIKSLEQKTKEKSIFKKHEPFKISTLPDTINKNFMFLNVIFQLCKVFYCKGGLISCNINEENMTLKKVVLKRLF